MNERLRLSAKGAAFIADLEGLRLTPYNDTGGNATIGIGDLLHLGPVTQADRRRFANYHGPGKPFTKADALALLQKDAEHAASAVRHFVKVKLSQREGDALISATFNLGAGWLEGSRLLAALNAGKRGSVPTILMRYDHDGNGHVVAGLARRRRVEGRLFATGNYSTA